MRTLGIVVGIIIGLLIAAFFACIAETPTAATPMQAEVIVNDPNPPGENEGSGDEKPCSILQVKQRRAKTPPRQ